MLRSKRISRSAFVCICVCFASAHLHHHAIVVGTQLSNYIIAAIASQISRSCEHRTVLLRHRSIRKYLPAMVSESAAAQTKKPHVSSQQPIAAHPSVPNQSTTQKPSNLKPAESPPKRPRPSHPPRPPLSTPLPKRPDAVSRELYLLTGGVTPAPLAPVLQKHTTTKPQRRHHWHFVPFTNSARKDGLTLSHWTKVGSTDSDYTFARFNKPIRMVNYTDAEYTAAVANLLPLADPPSNKKLDEDLPVAASGSLKHGIHRVPPQAPWTKKETDNLFQLCALFDLRFPVIHDRWPDDLPPRSIDELKDRYYSVAKRLMEWRTQQNARTAHALALQKHCQAITMNPFDYEYECVRKNQLEWHFNRSKAELREEEETVREARRIEQNRRRLQKERQRLAKLLTPARELASGGGSADNLTSSLMPQKTFPHRKPNNGAYARSLMIYAPVSQSVRISKRVDSALLELGVGLRPTPTAIVVDNFDLLRIEILSYIELQRTVCRKEEDTHLLRVKLAKLKGESVPSPPPGVTLSHKKRRAEDVEIGSLFGPSVKQQKS